MMNWEEAKIHLNAAQLLAKISGERLESIKLNLLNAWMIFQHATIFDEEFEKAENLFTSAITEAVEMHHLWYSIEGRQGAIFCALARKKTMYASYLFEEIENMTHFFKNRFKIAELILAKATVIHQLGKLEKAQEVYRDAIESSKECNYLSIESRAWTGLGATQLHMKDKLKSEISWKQALQIAQRCSPCRNQLTQINIKHSLIDPQYTPR